MQEDEVAASWDDIKLDPRLQEGIRGLKWKAPTLVQRACIPQALRGRDVAVQARTGTGKTGAFLIPIIQRLLADRELSAKTGSAPKHPFALICVPSEELSRQTAESATALCKFVKPRVSIEDTCATKRLSDASVNGGDIIIATAAALSRAIKSSQLSQSGLQNLRVLVVDEADWIIDSAASAMQVLQSTLAPLTLQVLLLSATLTDGVAQIKGHLQHNPTNIKLTTEDVDKDGRIVPRKESAASDDAVDESNPIVESHIAVRDTDAKTLQQRYLVAAEECHEHTLLYGLYRLQLIEGKTLVFVENEEDSYELQNFLEQLSIAAAVYDTHLPVNIRMDILRKFQTGAVATLICTDSTLERAEAEALGVDSEPKTKKLRRERRSATSASETSALHRGIDFANVRNVIIFGGIDAPSALSFNKYTHRVGRAGRAGEQGLSLLILRVPQAQKVLQPLKEYLKTTRGEHLRPFKKMQRAESAKLQYRVDTVLSNVTRTASRRIRVATVASELARSNYLNSHLSDKDSTVLKKIVTRSKRHVHSDRSLLELPKYMNLKHADNSKDYVRRVNARRVRKEDTFREAIRKKKVDPLKAIVAKVRQESVNARVKEARAKRQPREREE